MKQIPGYLDITPSDFMEVYLVAFGQAMARLKNAITADQIMNYGFMVVNVPLKLMKQQGVTMVLPG